MHISLKMSKQAILRLLNSNGTKYKKARCRKAKSALIEQLMELTGYKSTKSIIKHCSQKRKRNHTEKRERLPKLQPSDIGLVKLIWLKAVQLCGKWLHSMRQTWLGAFPKRNGIDGQAMKRVPSASPATLDRLLSRFKVGDWDQAEKQTIGALKQSIPIIDTTRKIDKPGHLYADTVAHCGDSARGSFVWSLTVTDDKTLWTNNRAIWNKGQEATWAAFLHLLQEIPFMIRSINTDNGSEFINYHLQRMPREKYKRCKRTRSRPCKKNDNARAEERNRHKARELIGYERLGDEKCAFLLNQVYQHHNLLANFFIASTGLVGESKNPATGKTKKQYDKARTPYERVLEHMKEGARKRNLAALKESLDPFELQENIQKALHRLFNHIMPKTIS